MRLNWNNIGKGLEAIAGAKKARDLAQTSARYDVTEGAYGEGLGQNLQQVIGLRDQALQQLDEGASLRGEDVTPAQRQQVLDQYTPAMSELSRRVGLQGPDYSVASGPTNFTTRQEARQAAAPLRAEGLAGVYRQYGDVAKADELEARAFDQQRAIAAEERAKTAESRAAQDFATRQTETGLRINQLARTEAEQQNFTGFNTFAAENPNLSVKELKDAAFKQFKFTPKQWQDTVATRLQIETGEMDSFKNSVKKKLQGKNLNQIGELYNSDPDFDDKTDLAIVPGKGGAVTLNFIDKATGRVTTSETFKSQALATEYLNKQATEPETIGSWMMNLQKGELGMERDRAAIEASKATTANARQEKLSPLEKNLAALKRLGVNVSPEEVKSMANIKAPALSPEAAAQIEIITASLKDNSTPANIEAARAAVTDIFRGEGLKQRNTRIVNGLKAAAEKNDLSTVVKKLQKDGVADETIVGLARQAGVSIPAELLPPAPVPQTGLNTNAPRQPIQLLAPFNAIGDYRRRMIEEQRAAEGSGGLVNPAGF